MWHIYIKLCEGLSCDNITKTYVVYQSIENDSIWIRDKDEFYGLVDDSKYPEHVNKLRFTAIGSAVNTDRSSINDYHTLKKLLPLIINQVNALDINNRIDLKYDLLLNTCEASYEIVHHSNNKYPHLTKLIWKLLNMLIKFIRIEDKIDESNK